MYFDRIDQFHAGLPEMGSPDVGLPFVALPVVGLPYVALPVVGLPYVALPVVGLFFFFLGVDMACKNSFICAWVSSAVGGIACFTLLLKNLFTHFRLLIWF